MSEQRETYGASGPDELPDDLKEPLIRLWQIEQPIIVQIKPRDAWIALGIIQFATRNPMISPAQRQLIETFGREMQRALVAIDESLEKYLETGWNPEYDRSV